jgi:hypothetical protein
MPGIWVRLTDKDAAHRQRTDPSGVARRRAGLTVPAGDDVELVAPGSANASYGEISGKTWIPKISLHRYL